MASTSTIISGISFPFRNFGNGVPARAYGIDVIRSAFVTLLRTKQRSRVMRPEVGMNLNKYIFEDVGSVTQSLITREILFQTSVQLPQIQITDIKYTTNPQNQKVIAVNVRYVVQNIQSETGAVPLT